MISLGRMEETDAGGEELLGVRASGGWWDEEEYIFRVFIFGEAARGDQQQVIRMGANLGGPFTLPLGPVRFMPHVKLGLQHRQEEPHAGIQGLAGIGIEMTIWLGYHWQIAGTAERNFGAGTTNEVGIEVRWGTPKLFGGKAPPCTSHLTGP